MRDAGYAPLDVIIYWPDTRPEWQRHRCRLEKLLEEVPFLLEREEEIRVTIARGEVWSHPGNDQLDRLHLIPIGPDEPWDAPRGLTWVPPTEEEGTGAPTPRPAPVEQETGSGQDRGRAEGWFGHGLPPVAPPHDGELALVAPPSPEPTVTLVLGLNQIETMGFALTLARRSQLSGAACWRRGSVPHGGYMERARRIDALRDLLDAACMEAGA